MEKKYTCDKCGNKCLMYCEVAGERGYRVQEYKCIICGKVFFGAVLNSLKSSFSDIRERVMHEETKTILQTSYVTILSERPIVLGQIRENLWECWVEHGKNLYQRFKKIEAERDPKDLLYELAELEQSGRRIKLNDKGQTRGSF